MFLVDSHCHFDLLDFTSHQNDLHEVITRAKSEGVEYFLNVCVKLADFYRVLKIAEQYPFISASVGSHPNEMDEDVDIHTLLDLGSHPKVIAIGETGLDYFRASDNLDRQQERFRTHIRAANTLQKPLIVHTRNAKVDVLRIMQEENAAMAGGVMHCFTEDWETAKKAIDMNFLISFSGIVTFNNATTLQEVAKKIPLEKMLIETDSPYLAPIPHRGKPNEPSYIRYTAEYIAQLHHISIEDFAVQTSNNFFNLFKGAVKPYV